MGRPHGEVEPQNVKSEEARDRVPAGKLRAMIRKLLPSIAKSAIYGTNMSALRARRIAHVGIVCFVSISAASSTYFISPQGDDSHSGTSPASAWRSAARASQVVFSSGDAVLFQGSVAHNLSEGGSGLTVRSAQGVADPAVIVASYGQGTAVLIGDGSRFDGITILNTGGVEVCNISLLDSTVTVNPHAVAFSGVHALSTGASDTAPKYNAIWIHDVSVTGFLFGVAVDAFSSCQGFSGVTIERVVATNATGTGISSQGSYSASCYSHANILVVDSEAIWNQVGAESGM